MHLIVALLGFTGILGKLINLEAVSLVWYRVLIAGITIGMVMIFTKKSFKVPNKKTLYAMLGVGVLVGLHWVTFYKSIQLSTASFGILCLSTATFHVAWIEPLVMKRKVVPLELILSGIIIVGVYFVSGDLKDSNQFFAFFFGLISALFASLFTVFNAKIVQTESAIKMTYYEMVSAFAVLTFVLIFQGNMDATHFALSVSDVGWLLFLGVICTSFAFLVMIEIVKYIGAFAVSLSINLEPVYTIILAIPFLHEHDKLDWKFYLGALLITLVVISNGVIKAAIKKRKKIKSLQNVV